MVPKKIGCCAVVFSCHNFLQEQRWIPSADLYGVSPVAIQESLACAFRNQADLVDVLAGYEHCGEALMVAGEVCRLFALTA